MDIRPLQIFKDEPDCVKQGLRIMAERKRREEEERKRREEKRRIERINERRAARWGGSPLFP